MGAFGLWRGVCRGPFPVPCLALVPGPCLDRGLCWREGWSTQSETLSPLDLWDLWAREWSQAEEWRAHRHHLLCEVALARQEGVEAAVLAAPWVVMEGLHLHWWSIHHHCYPPCRLASK